MLEEIQRNWLLPSWTFLTTIELISGNLLKRRILNRYSKSQISCAMIDWQKLEFVLKIKLIHPFGNMKVMTFRRRYKWRSMRRKRGRTKRRKTWRKRRRRSRSTPQRCFWMIASTQNLMNRASLLTSWMANHWHQNLIKNRKRPGKSNLKNI